VRKQSKSIHNGAAKGLMKLLKPKKREYIWFLLPALVLIAFIQFMPMFYNLWLSFFNLVLNKPNLARQFVGFQNYVTILSDPDFWNSIKVTLVIGFSSVILQLVLGLGLALLLNIRGPFGEAPAGMGFFRGVLFIPYMLMPIMVGLTWFIFADSTYGMLNPILSYFGIPTKVWFSDPSTTVWSIILMDTWQCTPMVMLILASGLKTIDRSLYEASIIDGANAWQKFRFITMPMLNPVLKVAVTMRLMDVLRIYDTIIATTKGGPGKLTEVMSIYTYKLAFGTFKTSQGATSALLITIMILILSQTVVKFLSIKNSD
jgi:multiple sugar transport system permease protein